MAGPELLFRATDQPGPHRIQMQIPHQFQQIALLVTEDGPMARLKDVTLLAVVPVMMTCVVGFDRSHG
jgi:hypothetical protein